MVRAYMSHEDKWVVCQIGWPSAREKKNDGEYLSGLGMLFYRLINMMNTPLP